MGYPQKGHDDLIPRAKPEIDYPNGGVKGAMSLESFLVVGNIRVLVLLRGP